MERVIDNITLFLPIETNERHGKNKLITYTLAHRGSCHKLQACRYEQYIHIGTEYVCTARRVCTPDSRFSGTEPMIRPGIKALFLPSGVCA